MRALVCALMICGIGQLGAQGWQYTAGTTRYRITQRTTMAQEAMGNRSSGEQSSTQLLTITLNRVAKDTLSAIMILDSAAASNTMGIPIPALEPYIGMKVNGRLAPSGKVYSVEPPKVVGTRTQQIMTGMGTILPIIRVKLAKGVTWSDSAVGKIAQFGVDLDRRVISRYRVVGDSTIGGELAWKITRRDSTTMSGSGLTQGAAMTMEGSSTSQHQFYMTASGAFAGGEGTEEGTLRVVASATGMEIAVSTTSTTKVQRVK